LAENLEEAMKVDGKLGAGRTTVVIEEVRRHEKAGYDGLWSSESAHDPFLPLVLAAEHTERMVLGTAIAVAFARSPMQLAYTAHDLQAYSGGRFILGLGSQVKPHIERRFSMPWSHPAPRMREFIMAMRAIWSAWNDGTRLSFRGDFYQHTLMTSFFSPPPSLSGPPAVFLAAVGKAMTEVAGEAADGLLVHAFSTERYLREVTLPALSRGVAASGRSRADLEVAMLAMIVTGRTEEETARAAAGARQQIAFYASTPAYRGYWTCMAGASWATSSTRCPGPHGPTSGRPWAASFPTRCCTRSRWLPSRPGWLRRSDGGSTAWSTGSRSTRRMRLTPARGTRSSRTLKRFPPDPERCPPELCGAETVITVTLPQRPSRGRGQITEETQWTSWW
jgi:probable F420-dependent oxidoreductase